jgi:hypothetical protein
MERLSVTDGRRCPMPTKIQDELGAAVGISTA